MIPVRCLWRSLFEPQTDTGYGFRSLRYVKSEVATTYIRTTYYKAVGTYMEGTEYLQIILETASNKNDSNVRTQHRDEHFSPPEDPSFCCVTRPRPLTSDQSKTLPHPTQSPTKRDRQ